jgi:hypothetical protein
MRDFLFFSFLPFSFFSFLLKHPAYTQPGRNKRIREQEKQKRMREDLASPTEKERRREK